MEVWELVARESIRDCIARYNANGDSGRIDEMVKVFAPDGIMETGAGRYEGRDAIRAFMSSGVEPLVATGDPQALLDVPTADLMAEAAALRDGAHGARITFSPKVFIPLTMLCRDRCGYCTFAKPPAHLVSPYLELDEVVAIARRGAELGCHEALFTLGEAPEDRYPVAGEWLAAHGYDPTVDYLVA